MIFINNQEEKTEEMIKYEKETGKKAIWREVITKDFKRWQKGEKIYPRDKERINILVSEEKKYIWEDFAKKNNKSTISKLIRNAVDLYIDIKPKLTELELFSKSIHNLKEELSSIKGFSQLLIQEHKDELSWEALLKIKEVIDKSVNIEKILSLIQKNKIMHVYDLNKKAWRSVPFDRVEWMDTKNRRYYTKKQP